MLGVVSVAAIISWLLVCLHGLPIRRRLCILRVVEVIILLAPAVCNLVGHEGVALDLWLALYMGLWIDVIHKYLGIPHKCGLLPLLLNVLSTKIDAY